ncbi:MAG: hypothetical protein GPI90_20580 [Microcystis aeruginosa K13-05]|nr:MULTISPECIES: hypothetical protein [unclassified Microcystis]MDJ0564476.1 hypothetical protein [Microcystis sp. M49629_WE12]NCR82162.1 hypothetical protein [Microcystis aeruginosa K13-10]NCR86878.1 hypothetical protein [Microcystis aeruginosa K13-05]MDJ0539306.1 hypothetical protein [Microcystis sp. M53603_WE2]MDJ0604508.1 hypothetical protein [Microcystis sp. M53602_WE12]
MATSKLVKPYTLPAPPMSGGLGGHTLPPGKTFCRKPYLLGWGVMRR